MADTEIINCRPGKWHLWAGGLMFLLGVFVWFNPTATLMALALYLGIIFIVVGAGYFIASFSYSGSWYWLVGILDMLVGVLFVSNLVITAVSLPLIFGLWCIAVGVVQTVAAIKMSRNGMTWQWSLAAGVLGMVFGTLIVLFPEAGVVMLTALMGAYIMLYGVLEILEYRYCRKLALA